MSTCNEAPPGPKRAPLPTEQPTSASFGDDTLVGDERQRAVRVRDLGRGEPVGRYIVIDKIGAGGMGVVFSAYDPELDRRVALKLLRSGTYGAPLSSSAAARLQSEARAMAKLSNPHVVTVFDVGTIDDSVFIAMEYVDGQTLGTWMRSEGNQAPWPRVLEIFCAAGRGLAAAHAAGLVHRDFKPDNVMLTSSGAVKVLDFGLARSRPGPTLAPTEAQLPADQTPPDSSVAGTPFYMAPEQHAGTATTVRSDQFSYCVALYEALYRQRPFVGERLLDLALNVQDGRLRTPPKSSHVPGRIRDAVLRGLAVDPHDRHPSMSDLLAALAPPSRARNGWRLALGAAALATVTGGLWLRDLNLDECRQLDQPVRELWTDGHRQSFIDSIAQAQVPVPLRRDTLEAFDRFAEQWVTQREQACRATRVRGAQSETVMELRYHCLDTRLDSFGNAVERVEAGAQQTLFELSDLAAELPSLAPCEDVVALRAQYPPPEDPGVRARVRQLEREIDQLGERFGESTLDQRLQRLQAVTLEATELGYPPLTSHARRVWGDQLVFAGQTEAGLALLEQALFEAQQAGATRAAAATLVSLLRARAERLSDYETALFMGRLAEATLASLPADGFLRSRLEFARARALTAAGRAEEAEPHARNSLQIRVELGHADTSHGLEAAAYLAWVLLSQDRVDEAAVLLDDVLARGRRHLGELHPVVATALVYRARLHSDRGDTDAALRDMTTAHDTYSALFGPSHANAAGTQADIATILRRVGRIEDALVNVQASIDALESSPGPPTKSLVTMYEIAAKALFQLQRFDEAHHALARVAELRLTLPGNLPALSDWGLVLQGRIDLARGRLDQARVTFEQALARGPLEEIDTTDVECGLGEVELAQGDLRGAEARLRTVLRVALADGQHVVPARAHVGLAKIAIARRRYRTAAEHLVAAEESLRDVLDQPIVHAEIDRLRQPLARHLPP